jgi:hypothetical protein
MTQNTPGGVPNVMIKPKDVDSVFYDPSKEVTMQKLTNHTHFYDRSNPRQHPPLTSRGGL